MRAFALRYDNRRRAPWFNAAGLPVPLGVLMTWSIVARDATGALGVAVASKFFAVGALCAHGQSGAGALSTQALVNPLLAAPALRGMAAGREPGGLLEELLAADPGRALRQFHMVDASGRSAAHT